jgi:hypothetical protein
MLQAPEPLPNQEANQPGPRQEGENNGLICLAYPGPGLLAPALRSAARRVAPHASVDGSCLGVEPSRMRQWSRELADAHLPTLPAESPLGARLGVS